MKYLVTFLLILSIACKKNKAVEELPSVLTMKEMSDLATVEYTVTKVIKANDNKTWYKLGDRKILMSCEATIKAGIDMSAINKNNFTINGKDISVVLPEPKIISINLPPEKIKVEHQDVDIFRTGYKSEERNALARQAETDIKNNIEALGILTQAKANTSVFVSGFLKRLGYENIRISYGTVIPLNPVQ